MARLVEKRDLEAALAELSAEVADPRAGLFGPASISWEIARESVLFLGAGRAALLQLAHPYVGTAVAEHSMTERDPLERFRRTFRRIFRMGFGDLDEARDAARRVYETHLRVRGTIEGEAGPFADGHPYDARDVEAEVWVLATLWDTSLSLFDAIVRPLSRAERARYYEEQRRLASLFGIAKALPPDYEAFERYFAATLDSDVLTVTSPAARVGRFIMRPRTLPLSLVRDDYGVFTAQLLPERIGRAFGLERRGEEGRRRLDRVLRLAHVFARRAPARLRYVPAYIEAMRRVNGTEGRDRVGELVDRIYLGSGRARS